MRGDIFAAATTPDGVLDKNGMPFLLQEFQPSGLFMHGYSFRNGSLLLGIVQYAPHSPMGCNILVNDIVTKPVNPVRGDIFAAATTPDGVLDRIGYCFVTKISALWAFFHAWLLVP
ncbi:hypothetical protein [Dyadobacter bucti]|uniref:hypothetical protein n=1 Tax=Dyadobacter bucti TaxID=2572203 RepID=UPI001407342E|nr:hypothetical protein [Dyadobacter bucti]